MFNTFIIAIVLSISAIAEAKQVKITVNGMVCSFCAQGIQKKFSAQDTVRAVDVNLGNHLVKLELKDGKDLGDKTIMQILVDAGYSVDKIEREP